MDANIKGTLQLARAARAAVLKRPMVDSGSKDFP